MLKRHNKNSNSSCEQSYSQPGKVYSASRKTCPRKISCFSAARACCKFSGVCLLLLTFLLINPTTTSVNALEDEEGVNHDDQISVQANSGVTISFTPSSGSASLTPATSDGVSAKINVSANIKIASTGGYAIYLGGKNSALTGEKTGETIAATSSAKTFANLDTNTWGYAAVEGLNVSDSTTYAALPQGQGIKLIENSGNATDVDHTFTLSFATKISNNKPADTYSNQVTLSVVNSPKTVTFTDYTTTMQGMTSAICSAVDAGAESQLRDIRDGKYYWVSKLADGRCWMTQNLDLDLSTDVALTPADSDVSSNWTPEYTTATTASSSTTSSSSTSQSSWSLGDYQLTNPTTSASCGYPLNDVSQCPGPNATSGLTTNRFTAYSTPTTRNGDANAHYILGNYYSWNTATAGTGGNITVGEAADSICPKNWQLPTSGDMNSGSFGDLINAGLIGTDVAKLASEPYYFVRGGHVSQGVIYLLFRAGNEGYYWSSTPSSNDDLSQGLYFSSASTIDPSGRGDRASGLSIRCIAR